METVELGLEAGTEPDWVDEETAELKVQEIDLEPTLLLWEPIGSKYWPS